MRYQIQRLSFGGIFDQSFQLMRENFMPLTIGFAILYVPYSVLVSLLKLDDPKDFSFAKLGMFFAVMLVMMVVAPLFQLAATSAIADAYQSRPTDFATSIERGKAVYMPYLGTVAIMVLFLIPLFMLLIIPGLFFSIAWSLIGPIAVVEQVFGRKALARSRTLMRGHWWRSVGLFIVAGMAGTAVTMGLQMVFGFIPLVGAALSGFVQAVTATYYAAMVVVLYVDLRCRHEDFDLQILAREVAGDHGAQGSAAGVPRDAAPV